MILLKKLVFAPFFLAVFALAVYKLQFISGSFDYIFLISPSTITGLLGFFAFPIIMAPLIMFASFLFVLFASLALNWKIVIPVGILASAVPMIFLNPIYGLILMVGILASLLLIYVFLEASMESYITFNADAVLGSHIKNLYTFLILLISFIVFLSINKSVPVNGFQVSESLLTKSQTTSTPNSQLPISNGQIDLLKQNPQLLKQFGLDPAILDNLASSQSNITNQLINQTVVDQIQSFLSTLNPYIRFVPMALAALLFLNLLSAVFILSFFLHPLLWLTFLILEKTGFTKYEVEMREVKKLVA